jgi:hypothetical protein
MSVVIREREVHIEHQSIQLIDHSYWNVPDTDHQFSNMADEDTPSIQTRLILCHPESRYNGFLLYYK